MTPAPSDNTEEQETGMFHCISTAAASAPPIIAVDPALDSGTRGNSPLFPPAVTGFLQAIDDLSAAEHRRARPETAAAKASFSAFATAPATTPPPTAPQAQRKTSATTGMGAAVFADPAAAIRAGMVDSVILPPTTVPPFDPELDWFILAREAFDSPARNAPGVSSGAAADKVSDSAAGEAADLPGDHQGDRPNDNNSGEIHDITSGTKLGASGEETGGAAATVLFRRRHPVFTALRGLHVRPVFFVGAGTGDDACTIAGVRRLQRCDVCLHDALIDPDILSYVRPGARLVDVGKLCGKHRYSQEIITRLIVDEARRGLRVVRLKGGDPGIFGRLAEEVEALEELRLPYRVIPGVSSLNAATTGTGILLTRRGTNRGFCVMTPRRRGGGTGAVGAAARCRQPVAFFMAARLVTQLANELLTDGWPPKTPAAIVFHAGSDREHIVTGTLDSFRQAGQVPNYTHAGLVLVGLNAARRHVGAWGPLGGQRIWLPEADPKRRGIFADHITDFGGRALEKPLARLVPTSPGTAPHPAPAPAAETETPTQAAAKDTGTGAKEQRREEIPRREAPEFDLVIFTDPADVEAARARWSIELLRERTMVAVGTAVTDRLFAAGLSPAFTFADDTDPSTVAATIACRFLPAAVKRHREACNHPAESA
jgi:uroporphyrin-III C-methyltransferase